MQTKFKDIAQYYLGTGLEIEWMKKGYFTSNPLTLNIDNYNFLLICKKGKPLLRSLDSLNKPITVKWYNDDKEFVPIEELGNTFKDFYIEQGNEFELIVKYKNTNMYVDIFRHFEIFQVLLKWHFNIFNLPETEYIKID